MNDEIQSFFTSLGLSATPKRPAPLLGTVLAVLTDGKAPTADDWTYSGIRSRCAVFTSRGGVRTDVPLAVTDTTEAWERLCTSVLPLDAVRDSRRVFGCECIDCMGGRVRERCEHCQRGLFITGHPASFDDIVRIASMWPRVVTAEAIGRTASAVMGIHADRVVWRVLPPDAPMRTSMGYRTPTGWCADKLAMFGLEDALWAQGAMFDAGMFNEATKDVLLLVPR